MVTATNWCTTAINDVEYSYLCLKQHSIFYQPGCSLDANYQEALKQARETNTESNYEKSVQTLINAQKVDFLFIHLKTNKVITPNGIETSKEPQSISVKLEDASANVFLPHFCSDKIAQWEELYAKFEVIKQKENITFDLSEYTIGSTHVAMKVFEKFFGLTFWDGLYQETYKNRIFTWRASKENSDSIRSRDLKNYPVPLQIYFTHLPDEVERGGPGKIRSCEPAWNSDVTSFKVEDNVLKDKKITIITCGEIGVAREVLAVFKKMANVTHIQKGTPNPDYFSERRMVQLPSGAALAFPMKKIDF